jgi:hypothetical protein
MPRGRHQGGKSLGRGSPGHCHGSWAAAWMASNTRSSKESSNFRWAMAPGGRPESLRGVVRVTGPCEKVPRTKQRKSRVPMVSTCKDKCAHDAVLFVWLAGE